jgi:DNA invertase Pin-like site-specific DNA recombinase
MKTCCLYARVSTDKQETLNQLQQLRTFADSQQWKIVAEYVDQGISGSTADRPHFKAMFGAASRHEFDICLFWSLDRFSRQGALETLQLLNRLSGYNVAWRSYCEAFLDSTGLFRDGVVGILGCIAKMENIRRSERTRAGLIRARKQGKQIGRPRVAATSDQVRHLRNQGAAWSDITRLLNISRATANRLAARAQYDRR